MNTNGDYLNKQLKEALVVGLMADAEDGVLVFGEDRKKCIKNALRMREEFELQPLGQPVTRRVGMKWFGTSTLEPVFVPDKLLFRLSHRKVKGWRVMSKENALKVVEIMNTTRVGVVRALELAKEFNGEFKCWFREMDEEAVKFWEEKDPIAITNAVQRAIDWAKKTELK